MDDNLSVDGIPSIYKMGHSSPNDHHSQNGNAGHFGDLTNDLDSWVDRQTGGQTTCSGDEFVIS